MEKDQKCNIIKKYFNNFLIVPLMTINDQPNHNISVFIHNGTISTTSTTCTAKYIVQFST